MDLKKNIWNQWLTMLHKQEERSKRRESLLLEQIKNSMPDYEKVGNLSVTELHVIQSIGDHEKMNVTSIAQHIGVTKSAISKITVKLMKKGLVDRYQLHDNQKEVFFRLTGTGQTIHAVHGHFHSKLENHMRKFLERYSESELAFMREVLRDATIELDKNWADE